MSVCQCIGKYHLVTKYNILLTSFPCLPHIHMCMLPHPHAQTICLYATMSTYTATVPFQLPPLPFILLPNHFCASLVLTRWLKCSKSWTYTKLWWNVTIVWRMEHHMLYLGPEATITCYLSTVFRYGTRFVHSKCNTITARFPMLCRCCVPISPQHLTLMACMTQL